MSMPKSTDSTATPVGDAAPVDAERREALRKLGTMAALTPPTVMTLLLSPRRSAASTIGDDEEFGGGWGSVNGF